VGVRIAVVDFSGFTEKAVCNIARGEGRTMSAGTGKENCWEFMKCGRQPRGRRVKEYGECPAAVESRLDGVHGGVNGGRACWIVAGTLCGGKIQGTFAEKIESCFKCRFFKKVGQEEKKNLHLPSELKKVLHRTATDRET